MKEKSAFGDNPENRPKDMLEEQELPTSSKKMPLEEREAAVTPGVIHPKIKEPIDEEEITEDLFELKDPTVVEKPTAKKPITNPRGGGSAYTEFEGTEISKPDINSLREKIDLIEEPELPPSARESSKLEKNEAFQGDDEVEEGLMDKLRKKLGI